MAQNLPDAEILFRTWAASHSSITDLVSTRIATRLTLTPEHYHFSISPIRW